MIAVFTDYPELKSSAEALACRLNLSFSSNADYLLWLGHQGLCLQKTDKKSQPLLIDFSSPRMTWRRTNTSMRKESLVRAMGLKSHDTCQIVDATAGLGRDSFILASLGFKVRLIERSPIIHALLNDGLQRGLADPALAPIIKNMELIHADAIFWLNETIEKPDIVYLDPMFPDRKKSALSKLDMRIFHDIAGDDVDADQLLSTALACAARRVVVKRPRLAEELAGIKPAFASIGSSSRFDIYNVRA